MKLINIKTEMEKYRDFYGFDLLNIDEVDSAKSKKELASILERHRSHMEAMLSDANSHLDFFKKKVGLHIT